MNLIRVCSVQSRLVGSTLLAALSVASISLALPALAVASPTPSVAPVTTAAFVDTGGEGRLMLVLDSSGSMAEPAGGGASKIQAAKSALRTLVNELPDEAQVGLRVFGAKVFSRNDAGSCEDTQQVVDPGTGNRDQLLDAIGDYEPYGETPIPNALREAVRDLGDEGPRSIVLVSDGESTCAPDPCKVAAELADQQINLQIDVVGLSVSGKALNQLQCVADKGNGTYYDADGADAIVDQLTRVGERALRPFTLTGKPIQGGPQDNPTAVTVGDWIDRLGPTDSDTGSKSYAVERTTSGSTLRVSAITQGQRGDDGLLVEIFGPEGDACATSIAIRQIDAREIVGVQATASADNECEAAGTYRITVGRRLADNGTVKFGLRVAEEPPVADPGFVGAGSEPEVTKPQVSGRAQTITGGSSFANAAAIGAGRWSSTIVPGEALLFRIPLDFGQAARISVNFSSAAGAASDTIGLFPPLAEISVYNPMQGVLSDPRDADLSGQAGGDDLTLLTATPAVSRDLIEDDGFNGVADYSMSGDYYVAVSLMHEDYSIEFPFKIEVEVVGEPADGPTYADDATWTVADGAVYPGEATDPTDPTDPSTSDATEEAGPDARGADDGDGVTSSSTIAAVTGLVGLLVVVGALLLWRRRRS